MFGLQSTILKNVFDTDESDKHYKLSGKLLRVLKVKKKMMNVSQKKAMTLELP